MDRISRGFVGRTVRAVVFIIPIIVSCTAIPNAGIYLASRFGLTQSRKQAPPTAPYLGNERKVELPGRGKAVEGNGWRLRNSRDSYTLTLDNAAIENAAEKNAVEKDISEENIIMENMEPPRPGTDITGDLTIGSKGGSDSWIRSEGVGIRIHSGTLVIRGKGSLDIEAGTAGILGDRTGNSQAVLRPESGQLDMKGTCAGIPRPEVDTAGGTGVVLASGQSGIGPYSCRLRVEESEGEIIVEGSCVVVLAGDSREVKSFIEVDEKAAVGPGNIRIVELGTARLENVAGHGEEIGGWTEGTYSSFLTYSSEDMATYNEDIFCFDGSVKTIRFAAK